MTEKTAQERILDAAIKSFADLGFLGTSTAQVARDAGVTQPLVHHHFASKDGLWKAAVDRVFGEMPGVIREEEGQLMSAGERLVRLSALRPQLSAILMRESSTPGPRLTYLIETYMRAPTETAIMSIREAQKAGAIDPALRADLLLMFMVGAGVHLFTVPAYMKELLGIDVNSDKTREDFLAVMRAAISGVLSTK